MRDIIVIRGKYTFKTAKGHQFKKKRRKEKKKGESREFGEREVQNLGESIML
jgi:hypothetical protein